jgi:zinc protease
MADPLAPLRLEYLPSERGLTLVRQSPPAGSASFSATYVGPGGWAYDPRGAEGTARLANSLVTRAVGPYGRAELARRLDRAGASLARQCAPESAEVSVWGPADAWEPLLGLLALAVQRPRFDAEDVEQARRDLVERQLREATQPDRRAEQELFHRLFPPGHPYRETGLGSRRSLPALTRSNLARYHRSHYTAAGGLLVVTAPAGAAAIRAAVRRRFEPFDPRPAPDPVALSARAPPRGLTTVDLPGRSQVEVRFGGPSIARSDLRYPAAFLANEILGGRPLLGRLFQRVREKGGLAYHASSDLEAMRWGGYWTAQAGTGADRWKQVVPMIERELARLRERSPTADEVALVRESAIGEIALSLESTSDAHELAVDAAYHGLPEDHWRRWPEMLRAVRPEEVRDAARAALGAEGQAAVVAGPLHLRGSSARHPT